MTITDRQRRAGALLWSAVAGLATWFALLPVRRRSLSWLARLGRAHRHGGVDRRAARRHPRHAAADWRLDDRDPVDGGRRRNCHGRRGDWPPGGSPRTTAASAWPSLSSAPGACRVDHGRPLTAELEHVRKRAGHDRVRPGRDPRSRAGAGIVSARARVLGEPRSAHAAGRPARDGRGARGRRGRRPDAVLQADRDVGRPAQRAWSTTCSTCRASRPATRPRQRDGAARRPGLGLLAALSPLADARRVRLTGTPAGGVLVRGNGPRAQPRAHQSGRQRDPAHPRRRLGRTSMCVTARRLGRGQRA